MVESDCERKNLSGDFWHRVSTAGQRFDIAADLPDPVCSVLGVVFRFRMRVMCTISSVLWLFRLEWVFTAGVLGRVSAADLFFAESA